jgi:hypothetical protein
MISASTANRDPRRARARLLIDASGAGVGDLIFVALAHRFPPLEGGITARTGNCVAGIALRV